jgi:hypothetical protein
MGLGVDLNFGYMKDQGFRVFPEIRGGWGYRIGPSMAVSFGYKNHSLLKKTTYESIQGYGNYANLGIGGISIGYSNSKLNPSPFSPNTWNIFSLGLASPGFSFGHSITFTRETFK